ncbi:MAG TPA: cytochrome c maturation protein CcmE [Candidatus Methanoperedens sp.]
MNKKQRLILGVVIIVALVGFLFTIGATPNIYEVHQAVSERENLSGKIINLNGTLVQGSNQYDRLNRTLTFKMTDSIETVDVIFRGENIEIPPEYTNIQVTVTGQFNGSTFEAYKKPLTKCPSKYTPDDIRQ